MNWMSSVFFKVCLFGFIGLACPTALLKAEGIIKGTVLDKNSGEPVIGAAVMLEQTLKGAATDLDGSFSISGIPAGKYNLHVSCLSYTTLKVEGVEITDDRTVELKIVLEAATEALEEVTVRAVRKMNSEVAMVNAVKASPVVMSAVSSQLITKSQDRDASEVVKRIPGISIIDDKFVIARGLSQRYNNVWINNSAVPSSEADSRAFSFDIVPSAQIENIMIMKSPSPEIPADFTGGFIKISTKDTPEKNQYMLSYGVSVNDRTHFRNFKYNKGSQEEKLEKIMIQKWIALYPNGQEAWTEWRRTGYPKLHQVQENRGSANGITKDKGIRRMVYPISFSQSAEDRANYEDAISKLKDKTDKATSRLWWDCR